MLKMERSELAAWLRLYLTPGIGNVSARKLLAAFSSPQAVFEQPTHVLGLVCSNAQIEALRTVPETFAPLLEATWQWLNNASTDSAQGILTLADRDYPSALLNTEDPPLLLYCHGKALFFEQPNLLNTHLARSIAIVGTRNPTPQGIINAQQFARALCADGFTVISGLALGIDTAAHEGALSAKFTQRQVPLPTIAIVGTGLDRVYPKQNLALARQIAQHGLLISEYPLGTPPLPNNFPKRNRLIAGLTLGTLVVEASQPSGSLITARLAAEQGREVFAIPGSIHAPQSRGCHALIRQGAKLVESSQDIIEELCTTHSTPAQKSLAFAPTMDVQFSSDNSVLEAMGFDPVSLDALQARTGLDTATLQVKLLELELDALIARLPGGLFQRMGLA